MLLQLTGAMEFCQRNADAVCPAEAYRRAVDLNPRDYRAWYGLGQTYELLHMPFYALHYFRRATQARARARVALRRHRSAALSVCAQQFPAAPVACKRNQCWRHARTIRRLLVVISVQPSVLAAALPMS